MEEVVRQKLVTKRDYSMIGSFTGENNTFQSYYRSYSWKKRKLFIN